MYETEYCRGLTELYEFIKRANEKGYEIITMTEKGGYTIIYKTNYSNIPINSIER